jgi:hypothetical protein
MDGIQYTYSRFKRGTIDHNTYMEIVKVLPDGVKRNLKKTKFVIETILKLDNMSNHDERLDSIPFEEQDKELQKQAIKRKNRRVLEKKKKDISITIENMEIDLIPAMKCTLWSMDNKPSTTYDIYKHLVYEGKRLSEFTREEHITFGTDKVRICNEFFVDSSSKDRFGKTLYLYSNPTDKRQGYFWKGHMYTLKELSELSGVLPVTIHRRFDKMSMEKSLG